MELTASSHIINELSVENAFKEFDSNLKILLHICVNGDEIFDNLKAMKNEILADKNDDFVKSFNSMITRKYQTGTGYNVSGINHSCSNYSDGGISEQHVINDFVDCKLKFLNKYRAELTSN